MQKVTTFRTADKRLFEVESEAIEHEFDLAIRGFLQSRNNLGNTGGITVTQAAQTIAKNLEPFLAMINTHKRRMNGLARRAQNEKSPDVIQVS